MNEEARKVHVSHRDFYLQLAEQANEAWQSGQQVQWLPRLTADDDNLRVALEWSASQPDGAAALTRLTAALTVFWEFTGRFTEARQWTERALDEQAPPQQRIRALVAAARLAPYLGDFETASSLLDESLELARQHGDAFGEALTHSHRAYVALTRGDFAEATSAHLEGLARWRSLGDLGHIADSLTGLGTVAVLKGDVAEAHVRLEEALPVARACGQPFRLADALRVLGFTRFLMGDGEAALPLLREGLAIFHRLGAQAQIAQTLDAHAFVAGTSGKPLQAAKLLGAAAALYERLGVPRPAAYESLYQQLLGGLQAALGSDVLNERWLPAARSTLTKR